MFGIGGTELIVIAVVLLIAVGPNKLPNLLKAVVKGYREFRKATRELRASTGIDELLQDEDLRDLRKPLYVPPMKPVAKPAAKVAAVAPIARPGVTKQALGYEERAREAPPEGVDVAEARDAMHRPSPEEAERIRAQKQAIVEAKIAAKRAEEGNGEGDEEHQRVVAAKLASVAPEPELDEEERQRIIDAKLAARDAPPSGEAEG